MVIKTIKSGSWSFLKHQLLNFFRDCFQWGLKARNAKIRYVCLIKTNIEKILVLFFSIFLQFGIQETFIKPVFFGNKVLTY